MKFPVLVVTIAVISSTTSGKRLGEYISHFNPLFYDSLDLHERHLITRRSIYDKVINLQLPYGENKLELSLYPADDGTFHPEAILSSDGKEAMFDPSHLYSGYLKGDTKSSVTGSIIRGVFQGIIRTGSNEVYYVDRKEYHPSHSMTSNKQVHSVIYKQDDVDVDKFNEMRRVKRGARDSGFCGMRFSSIANWMNKVEHSSLDENSKSGRDKRATTPTDNICNLFMSSDPEMWTYYTSILPDADATMITQEISALFRELVKEVNGIYRITDFNGLTGFELRVDRLSINRTCTGADNHWFCDKDIDVSNFLNLNTYTEHDAYCLAYVLTYRDFADGTLGLAWVAQAGSLNGGICSEYKTYSENGSPRKKSLNTGIVTIKNYGEKVPKLMSQLTLAHEIGHNFGSEHDPTGNALDCTPYTDNEVEEGNYIMYYAAISGRRTNNIKFSQCSINSISKVLSNNKNTQCFKANYDGHCGNMIKDGTEQCDCGYRDNCQCCVGQSPQNNAPGACTLKTGVPCDPSMGPCCTANCGYHASTVECAPATECSNKSYCDGSSVACPAATSLTDGTLCNGKTQVCETGECSGSVCSKIGTGWTECSLSASDNGVTSAALCAISCHDPVSQKCYSSTDKDNMPQAFLNMLNAENSGDAITVKPGYPCDKDQGFCDYFLTCRKINELGPLAMLKNLLLSLTSLEELNEWLKGYWWVVLLSIAGLVTFTALLVKFGAVFTPSSNPDKKPNRRLSKPLTKPTDTRRRAAGPTIGDRERDSMEMSGLR